MISWKILMIATKEKTEKQNSTLPHLAPVFVIFGVLRDGCFGNRSTPGLFRKIRSSIIHLYFIPSTNCALNLTKQLVFYFCVLSPRLTFSDRYAHVCKFSKLPERFRFTVLSSLYFWSTCRLSIVCIQMPHCHIALHMFFIKFPQYAIVCNEVSFARFSFRITKVY